MWNNIIYGVLLLLGLIFKRKSVENAYKKIRRDIMFIKALLTMIFNTLIVINANEPVHRRFEIVAKRHPNKTAFLFEDETWTFAQIEKLANRVAIYFEQQGYKQGDCVAILLHNCPEYTPLWLGLSKIGVIGSLLNTNLGVESLMHSIKIVNCKAIIFGSNFHELITNHISPELSLKSYQFNRFNESTAVSDSCVNLAEKLNAIDATQPLQNIYNIGVRDTLFYIYTSGTTGLSKAAIVNHIKYQLFRSFSKILVKNAEKAVIYCPMPLYHGSGVALGVGQMVLSGATIALRKKFSASNYWKDCKKYNCNVGQYIGEMLRYVLISSDNEKVEHSLDVIYGNGLKPEIWKEFIQKYNVKRVMEFYGATEGTFFLYNIDNTIGNTGYVPPYIRKFLPFTFIRFSEETGEPVRNNDGFCIECKPNEPGLAIGRINETKPKLSLISFAGYTDKNESSKKILRNVFKKGDCFFNSGDLLSFDEEGYFYFADRIGDTFRWKGENVSTTEIESIISKLIGMNDALVYGVKVPGTEGRAGMVSLVDPDNTLDLDVLLKKFKEHIASYAVPIFVRLLSVAPLTSTWKLQKYNLRSEGFNINLVQDPLYFYNITTQKYVPLTKEIYNTIMEGKIRL